MNSAQFREIIAGSRRSSGATAARCALAALEPPYRLAVAVRNTLFNKGLRSPARLGRAVISVGNLTAGGTGKTPMVVLLAERLISMGHVPAVLLRGYHAVAGVSDEALLLADELGPTVPVEANPDRVAGARSVLSRAGRVDVFLLDDGFQHRQVGRDLDIVLIDATAPFGFGRLLPRGLLREPVRNLRRADAVIVTRADQVPGEALQKLDQKIADLTGKAPLAHAAHRWIGLKDQDDRPHPLADLAEVDVLAAAGIGNGAAFVDSAARHARKVVDQRHYPDHHAYSRADIAAIIAAARQAGAQAVVTTTKDWVKWRTLGWPDDAPLPVYRPAVRMALLHGDDALKPLLEQTLRRPAQHADS